MDPLGVLRCFAGKGQNSRVGLDGLRVSTDDVVGPVKVSESYSSESWGRSKRPNRTYFVIILRILEGPELEQADSGI